MELSTIDHVGPKTIEYLNKLNIFNVEDLINYYPYNYNILKPISINQATDETIIINGIIENNARVSYIKRNLNRVSFRFLTDNVLINVVIFNRAFIKNSLTINKEITLMGKYNKNLNTFTASDIRLKKITDIEIEPKYHLIKEIKKNNFIKLMDNVLSKNLKIDDYIPIYLSKSYNFLNKNEAVKYIHKPNSIVNLKQAKLRLIYEELFVFMFKINYLKYKNSVNNKYLKRSNHENETNNFIDKLSFSLTVDQKQAVCDIISDFSKAKRMNRLILGDVGSGKTIISFIAIYMNYLDGYQSALMAPTEILAKQHFEKITELFKAYDIKVALLIGSMKNSLKKEILNEISLGNIDVVIGTHALLSESIEFNNLGLVITDEQHRFGVNQRSLLQNKGLYVDVIYMSATPIPRTYALTLYGDMDTSLIKSKPNGRKEVKTIVKKENEISEVLYAILEELKKGHQIYVVAPSIEDNEDSDLNNVNQLEKKFKEAFKDYVKIGVLHGKQKAAIKEQMMVDFKNKKYNILISTTVIEVGIDVSNATMMVIFNAERFGLATLHQLRGRVGRSSLDSYCYLISNKDALRLKVLTESNDGFYISQKDFELRKSGDLFGEKQSGDMTFKIADLTRDYKILTQAKKDSQEFIEDNIDSNFINYPWYNSIIKEIDFID